MDKPQDERIPRDRKGEIFQNQLTENQSKPRGPRRDDTEHTVKMDPQVDSQEADRAMEENRFGVNEKKTP